MNNWLRVKLKEVLKQYRNTLWVEDKEYKQVTISQTGEVSYRGTKHGAAIGRKRQFNLNINNPTKSEAEKDLSKEKIIARIDGNIKRTSEILSEIKEEW